MRDPHSPTYKRLVELMIASLAGIVALPVLGVVALLIRIMLGSPVLFRQTRVGQHGKQFILYKFRSMVDIRDSQGRLLPDECRMTSIGRALRRLSVDELPELINVLRGEMGLVGPRPLLVQYLERYTPEQARRHDVKPGITGWAQVHGRNALTWEEKFKLDVWYVDNRSLWLDLRILATTAWKVMTWDGINQAGYATAEEFRGTPDSGKSDLCADGCSEQADVV
jgi:sugar transferase EpsL